MLLQQFQLVFAKALAILIIDRLHELDAINFFMPYPLDQLNENSHQRTASVFLIIEIEFNAIASRVGQEKLNLPRRRDHGNSEFDSPSIELMLIGSPARATKCSMVKSAEGLHRPAFIGPGFGQVQDRLPSRIQPIPEAAKRRPLANFESNDLAVEVTQVVKQGPWCAQVVMAESNGWHSYRFLPFASSSARRASTLSRLICGWRNGHCRAAISYTL